MFHAPASETKQQRDSARTELRQGYAPMRAPQPLARLHSTYGNQAVLRMLSQSAPGIQAKLTVNEPGDVFEQEADRVADQVMRMTAVAPSIQRKCSSCEEDKVQRKCAECEEEEKKTALQRKESTAGPQFAPPSVHAVLNSPGRSLDPVTRAFMEPRFGHDFSQVRVHTDSSAAESAESIHALAYTAGSNITFAHGQYQPGTNQGRRLIAHELVHVVQQAAPASHGIRQVPTARLQRQPRTPAGLAAPDPKAFGNADPEAATLLTGVISSGGAKTIPIKQPLTAGPLPNGGSITITFDIVTTLPAAGITSVASVSGLGTSAGVIAISMLFNSAAPTQQTWFHEFQHVLILTSKELLKNAAQTSGSTQSTFTPAMTAAMTSSKTAARYWADMRIASTLPESQAVISDYKTIVGAARTAAAGSTVTALSDSDVTEHVINERRAKLEEQKFVTVNKRGTPSSAIIPNFIADELIVPLKAQMTPAQQSTFNDNLSPSGLGLQPSLEASLTRLFAKLP